MYNYSCENKEKMKVVKEKKTIFNYWYYNWKFQIGILIRINYFFFEVRRINYFIKIVSTTTIMLNQI